jgi:hypothetical protein
MITWRVLAVYYPEFVEWIVQRHGPLPEGGIVQADYERFRDEYLLEHG